MLEPGRRAAARPRVTASAAFARAQGWDCRDLPAAHDAMITHPAGVAAELHALAT